MFTPITLPTPPAEQRAAALIIANAAELYAKITQLTRASFDLVWHNPEATPDKVVAALGPNALGVFMASAALAGCANAVAGAIMLPETRPVGWNFIPGSDGSVALTPLTITDISPVTGMAGDTITITGVGFIGAPSVTFGDAAGVIPSATDTQIVVTAPVGVTGTVDVVVTTPAGSSAAAQFTYV